MVRYGDRGSGGGGSFGGGGGGGSDGDEWRRECFVIRECCVSFSYKMQ